MFDIKSFIANSFELDLFIMVTIPMLPSVNSCMIHHHSSRYEVEIPPCYFILYGRNWILESNLDQYLLEYPELASK